MFHADATWNHRNDYDCGVKAGNRRDPRVSRESMALTEGSLRPVLEVFMTDGVGHVAVLTRISGIRPDERSFDDTQILLFKVKNGRVHAVDQFIGDPTAVRAFWR